MGFGTQYNPTIVCKQQGRDLATCTKKRASTFFWMANLVVRMNNIKKPVGITAPSPLPQLLMMVRLGFESNEHLASGQGRSPAESARGECPFPLLASTLSQLVELHSTQSLAQDSIPHLSKSVFYHLASVS